VTNLPHETLFCANRFWLNEILGDAGPAGSLAQLPSAPAYSTRARASRPIHQRKKKRKEKGARSGATLAFFFCLPLLLAGRCRLHAAVMAPGLYSDIGKKTRGLQHRFSLCSALSFSVPVLVRWPIDTLLDPDAVMPGCAQICCTRTTTRTRSSPSPPALPTAS
jgi:hypothetical protein